MRTTPEQVAEIIELNDPSDNLQPFIEVSNELVTEVCSGQGYTESRMELIERWLSGHFYAVRNPRPSSEKAGTVGESFQYKVGLNLAVTTYGQQAMILDTKGGLAALSKSAELGRNRKVGVQWLGGKR